MRGRAVLLGVLVVLLILPLTVPAGALSDEEILTAQEEALELDRLEQAAKNSGGTARYGETLEHGLDRLLDQGLIPAEIQQTSAEGEQNHRRPQPQLVRQTAAQQHRRQTQDSADDCRPPGPPGPG